MPNSIHWEIWECVGKDNELTANILNIYTALPIVHCPDNLHLCNTGLDILRLVSVRLALYLRNNSFMENVDEILTRFEIPLISSRIIRAEDKQ